VSSEIENIVTTNDELYRAAASPDEATDPQTKEVLGYRAAMLHGLDVIRERTLSTNLFVEVVSNRNEQGWKIDFFNSRLVLRRNRL